MASKTPKRKLSKIGARVDTIDIEKAVQQIISRLMEDRSDEQETREELEATVRELLARLAEKNLPEETFPRPPEKTCSPDQHHITFINSGEEKIQTLSPQFLTGTVIPFIKAVISLQKALDDVRKKPHRKISILEIGQSPELHATLDGGKEAIDLVHEFIAPWKRKFVEGADLNAEGTPASGNVQQRLPRSKIQLALDMINQVASDLEEQEKIAQLGRFLLPLEVILLSELETSGQNVDN